MKNVRRLVFSLLLMMATLFGTGGVAHAAGVGEVGIWAGPDTLVGGVFSVQVYVTNTGTSPDKILSQMHLPPDFVVTGYGLVYNDTPGPIDCDWPISTRYRCRATVTNGESDEYGYYVSGKFLSAGTRVFTGTAYVNLGPVDTETDSITITN